MNNTGMPEIANRAEQVGNLSRHSAAEGAGAPLLEEYEARLAVARERFDQHPAVKALFRDPIDPTALEAFLISFAIVGVRMTEPVEGWIRRAGRRCGELGLEHLAKALATHAHQEADHHLLMLADARLLVERWNKARKQGLDVDILLGLPPTPGVAAYAGLHEGLIAGPTPYGQLAVEYEIEMLSVTYGPRLLDRCKKLLGEEILKGLSFLTDHVALDAGHTNFNRFQLGRLLEEQPAFLSDLVSAGSEALDAYAVFLGDCIGFLRSPAIAHKTAAAYEWHLVSPTGCTGIDPSVLVEFSEFRGRILYAGGRRPRFQREGMRYADEDSLDSRSFHITARRGGDLVGYTRIRPLPEYSQSSLGRLVTRREFEAALKGMRLMRNDCLEVSRWIVAPSERGTSVAPTLVVSAWAVGRWLGKRRLLATVGTRDGQMAMLARYGGQVLRSTDAKFIAEYDDELATMYFDLNCPPPRVAAKLNAAAGLLKLADIPLGQSESDE